MTKELTKVPYNEHIRSHHPKSILYWVIEGIMIDNVRYPIEEFRLKDDGLYAIVSEEDRYYYEVKLTEDNSDELQSQVEDINKRIKSVEDSVASIEYDLKLDGNDLVLYKKSTNQEIDRVSLNKYTLGINNNDDGTISLILNDSKDGSSNSVTISSDYNLDIINYNLYLFRKLPNGNSGAEIAHVPLYIPKLVRDGNDLKLYYYKNGENYSDGTPVDTVPLTVNNQYELTSNGSTITLNNKLLSTDSSSVEITSDDAKEQRLSVDDTLVINSAGNATEDKTSLRVNDAKIVKHDNLLVDDTLTKTHEDGSTTTTLSLSENYKNTIASLQNQVASLNSNIQENSTTYSSGDVEHIHYIYKHEPQLDTYVLTMAPNISSMYIGNSVPLYSLLVSSITSNLQTTANNSFTITNGPVTLAYFLENKTLLIKVNTPSDSMYTQSIFSFKPVSTSDNSGVASN